MAGARSKAVPGADGQGEDREIGTAMPVFISYSHADKEVAETLALNLVQAKQKVWIDSWELNPGDSLIAKIEGALGGADAILVLLSENSVNSEWCGKELRTGLLRELEEKAVLVIPVVVDECEIPLFLREKMYVDFRRDRDEALALLLRSLARISNAAQSRAETPEFHVDWSVSGISNEDLGGVQWTFVDHGHEQPYVILTEVRLVPTGGAQRAFGRLRSHDARYAFVARYMEGLLRMGRDWRVLITDVEPVFQSFAVPDLEYAGRAEVLVVVRRMGQDTGQDTLFDVEGHIRAAVEHSSEALRSRSEEQ